MPITRRIGGGGRHSQGQSETETVSVRDAREVAVASNNITRLLQSVHDKLRGLLEMDRFYVALYDRRRGRLEFPLVVEQRGGRAKAEQIAWPERAVHLFEPLPDDEARVLWPDWVVVQGKTVLCDQDLPKLKPGSVKYWPPVGKPPLSWLGVPLVAEERILGALVVENQRKAGVFGQQVGLVTTVARQIAIALANTRLRERLERQVGNLNALYKMGQELTASIQLSEQQIIGMIYKWASQVMDTKNMYIALYDEQTDEVRFALAYRDDRQVDIESEEGWQPRRAGKGRTEWIIHHRQPLLDETRVESEAWYKEPGREEYIGQPFASWVGVPMITGDKVLGVIATYHASTEYVYDEDDVQVLKMLANQAAVAIEKGRLYAIQGQIIAELESAQKRIVETEAVISRTSVAADFVHRLNNLAGTIPVWLDLARERIGPRAMADKELREYLDRIESDADGLLRAAEQLKFPPKEQDVHTEAVLNALVRQALVQMPTNIEISLVCEENLLPVRAVATDLTHALWSIMENGIDAMPEGGQLTIHASSSFGEDESRQICIRFTDEGQGIPDSEAEKVFLPFYSTKQDHLGYGLWRARNVIERIGGSITVQSDMEHGATFIVLLPVVEEAAGNG